MRPACATKMADRGFAVGLRASEFVSPLEGVRDDQSPELIWEISSRVGVRSCLRKRSSNCRSPRVSHPGEGTFPRTNTHVCGAREVGWIDSQYEFSHPTRLTLLGTASRGRTGRSSTARSTRSRSGAARSTAMTAAVAAAAAVAVAAAELGQVALRHAELRALEPGHLPAALVATAVAAAIAVAAGRSTSSRSSAVRSASRGSGTRWRTGRGSGAARSACGRGRTARSTRLSARSRAARRGRATVMVEQPSVRRASDAKQHGERQNPLHSGISSRNVSDSRELFLPYGPLTRRSNAVESSLGLGGH